MSKVKIIAMYALIVILGASTGTLWANNASKDDALSEAVSVISKRNEDIKELQKQSDELIEKNKKIHEENVKLDKENKDLKELANELQKDLDDVASRYINLEATAYTALCSTGCIGITKTGYNVKNTVYYKGMRVVAVDPNLIPLYTVMEIQYSDGSKEKVIALDTGGDIKGHRVDILVKTKGKARNFGRQDVTVKVLEWG